MKTFLSGGLPQEIEGVSISPDFRNMLRVLEIEQDKTLDEWEQAALMLHQLFPVLPFDAAWAIEKFTWFLNRGKQNSDGAGEKRAGKKSYDFMQDADLIFSAFYAAYGIDLAQIPFLHWWAFLAMFEGLPDDCLMKKVMYWRRCDTSKMSKEERKHAMEMRKHFALKREGEARKTIAEIEQSTHDYYEKRIELAQKRAEESGRIT